MSQYREYDWIYFLRLFQNKIRTFAFTVTSTLAAFLLLYAVIPKKFKSSAQITIYSQYFQNPLIKDFISEQYDPIEMRTQREAIIQQALDEDFIEKVGEEFKLFKTEKNSPKRGFEREELRKGFEVFSLSSDTFQIGFIYKNPEISEQIAHKTLSQVVQVLVEQRRKTITNVRNAVRARMESMVLYKNNGIKSLGSTSNEQIQIQLNQIKAQISALLQQYTEKHPRVTQLRARQHELEKYLTRNPKLIAKHEDSELPPNREAPETLSGAEIESSSKEVYADLLKKYNYLNVAIDMEKANDVNYYAIISSPSLPLSPLSPKLLNFIGYGLASGILLSIFLLLFDELVRFNLLNAERRAKWWGLPLLGTVPRYKKSHSPTPILPLDDEDEKQSNDWH